MAVGWADSSRPSDWNVSLSMPAESATRNAALMMSSWLSVPRGSRFRFAPLRTLALLLLTGPSSGRHSHGDPPGSAGEGRAVRSRIRGCRQFRPTGARHLTHELAMSHAVVVRVDFLDDEPRPFDRADAVRGNVTFGPDDTCARCRPRFHRAEDPARRRRGAA